MMKSEEVTRILENAIRIGKGVIRYGSVASYIPELAKADKNKLGICLYTIDGNQFETGNTEDRFTIQSISKVMALCLALETFGAEFVFDHVGVEPSGEAFNSLVELDNRSNRPFNPMINSGAITVANLIGGKMADRFNKKMNIVYLDMISVISYIICGLLPLTTKSIVLMFIASTCQNMENPSYNSLTADITLSKDRERGYSLQYLTANLGGVMASAVAGFMFRNYLWLAFLLSGISIGTSSVLIYFFVQNITPEKEENDSNAIYQAERHGESLLTILKENRLVLLFILITSGYTALYQMYNYLFPMDLIRLHGDTGAVIFGTVTSINCFIVVLFTPFITQILKRSSEPKKTIYGFLLTLVGYVLFILFSGHIPFYYAAMVVLTWGEISYMLAESPYMTRRIPSSHRGRIHGLMEIIRIGFMSLYQLLIGFIYKNHTPIFTWIIVLLTGVAFLLLAVILTKEDKKRYKNLYRRL